MARTTSNMAAVSVTASGKVTAVSASVATQVVAAELENAAREASPPPAATIEAAKARPANRGTYPSIPGH